MNAAVDRPGSALRVCIVVPYFRHENAIAALLARLRGYGVPCWLVDDGSGGKAATTAADLAAQQSDWLRLLVLPHNCGKGAAVRAGCVAAAAAGYTHAIQIDADGQHDPQDLPLLVSAAERNPAAVVTGVPRYDESIPRLRYYGRYLTHALVWLYTWSFDLTDTMCGFRVYPLATALRIWETRPVGERMDFDTEMLVRLYWAGVPVINVPTSVTYPADGVSHFRYFRDNLRMIWLHLRLLAAMPWHLQGRHGRVTRTMVR
ncbi:MAG TPA: glycosyltransferase family 2 protein [Nevskiaceae bacterium]|nr:glycosyltransferase family 2 protein [Nevskiaceae bacterium]